MNQAKRKLSLPVLIGFVTSILIQLVLAFLPEIPFYQELLVAVVIGIVVGLIIGLGARDFEKRGIRGKWLPKAPPDAGAFFGSPLTAPAVMLNP